MRMLIKLKKAIGEEFELHDIFDDIKSQNVRSVLAENIEYTLKREKLLPPGHTVLIPVGGDRWEEESEKGTGFVQGDFEIFAPDMNTIVAYGTAYGSVLAGELLSLTTEITKVTGEVGKPIYGAALASHRRRSGKGSSGGIKELRR